MSGHSKWHSIKHQKGSADAKRGKLFSMLSKKISIAARSGKDTETNTTLKMIVEKARAENMPNDTIDRAIKRGAGELPGHGQVEEVVYEGYGPEGVQLIIVTTTDNKNRTTANVRHALSKNSGSLSGTGSVMWNFERTDDCFLAKSTQRVSEETKAKVKELIEALEEDEDVEEVFTNMTELNDRK